MANEADAKCCRSEEAAGARRLRALEAASVRNASALLLTPAEAENSKKNGMFTVEEWQSWRHPAVGRRRCAPPKEPNPGDFCVDFLTHVARLKRM